jgi:hypothetical protein
VLATWTYKTAHYNNIHQWFFNTIILLASNQFHLDVYIAEDSAGTAPDMLETDIFIFLSVHLTK